MSSFRIWPREPAVLLAALLRLLSGDTVKASPHPALLPSRTVGLFGPTLSLSRPGCSQQCRDDVSHHLSAPCVLGAVG